MKKRTIKFGSKERFTDELLWFPELPPDGKKDGTPRLCLMAEEWAMITHFIKRFNMAYDSDKIYGLILTKGTSRFQIRRQGDHLNIIDIDEPEIFYDILEFVRALNFLEKIMKTRGHTKIPAKYNILFEIL